MEVIGIIGMIISMAYIINYRIKNPDEEINTKHLAIFVLFMVIAAVGFMTPNNSTTTSKTTEPPTTTSGSNSASTPQPTPEDPVTTWYEVTSFEGNSHKNTETFNVSGYEWRINWSTEPDPEYGDSNFVVFVHNEKDGNDDLAVNIIGAGGDTTYMRGSGDYYLEIKTRQPYEITIEEKR